MALSVVQATGLFGSGVSSITIGAITTTSGNLLHVDATCYSGQAHALAITDSKSNTWSVGVPAWTSVNTFNTFGSFYAKNITGGASHTVTLSLGGSGIPALAVAEVSGADTTSPLGLAEHFETGNTGTPSMTTSGSASSGDIAFGAMCNDTSGVSVTEMSGWATAFDCYNNGGTQLHSASKVLTSTGAVTYSPTTGGTPQEAMQITTYKASGGAVNPTFAITGSGTVAPRSAASAALSGSGTTAINSAAVFAMSGAGTLTGTAQPSGVTFAINGSGSVNAIAASISKLAGSGSLNALAASRFVLGGSGAVAALSASRVSLAGSGSISGGPATLPIFAIVCGAAVSAFPAIRVALNGSSTVVAIAVLPTWSPQGALPASWTPQIPGSTVWTKRTQ